MKIFYTFAVAYAVCLLAVEISGEQNTKTKRGKKTNLRPSRQLNNNNADQMVQNILKWLQDVYGQQSRSSRSFVFNGGLEPPYSFASARIDRHAFRQDALREYLPPTMSQKPRPFEPRPVDNGGGVDNNGNFVDSGYPPAGSVTPQPPFTIYTNPATGGITGIGSPGIPDEYSTGSTETISSATTNFPLKTDVTEVSSVSTKLSDVTENNQDSEPSLEIDITSGTTYLPPVSESIPTKLPDVTGSDTGTEFPPGTEIPSGTGIPSITEVPGLPTDFPQVTDNDQGTEFPPGTEIPSGTGIPSITEVPGLPTDFPQVTDNDQGTEFPPGTEIPSGTGIPSITEVPGLPTDFPQVTDNDQGTEFPPGTEIPSGTGIPSITEVPGLPTDFPQVTDNDQGTEFPPGTEIPSGTGIPSITEVPGLPTDFPQVTDNDQGIELFPETKLPSGTTYLPPKDDVTELPGISSELPDVTENNQGTETSSGTDIPLGSTSLPVTEGPSVPTEATDRGAQGTEYSPEPEFPSGATSFTVVSEGSTETPNEGTTPGPESPTQGPQVTEQVTGYPTRPPYQPGISTQPPELIVPGGGDQTSGTSEQTPGTSEQGIPEVTPGYTTGIPVQETQGYPSGKPQSEPTGYPSIGTSAPSGFTASTEIPSFPTIKPTTGEPAETESPSKPIEETEGPLPSSESATAQPSSAIPEVTGTVTEGITGQTEGELPGASSETPTEDNPATGEENAVKGVPDDDDSKHPPHIHALDVQCAKEMMTIDIEFNREFDGVIYSKGYYNMPECRYVNENSGQTKYTFTVNLNMCGTEFVNAFDTEGRSYLENVLVLQNEAGIQEVWDTVRSVRCLWEGSLKEQLSVTLMVGMLSQEIVTFSGDTAVAKLDVVLGRGPFGQPASGLVKIGEQMTLVVSVSGDPGFDVQVKDCRAADSSGSNIVPLTDDNGCILKPKLFGSFQKTRNTGETGASIIAYAYFNAFKFPDVMDIMIECNIELCKTDCEMCPEPNQQIEPAKRRKRDISNETLHDSILMAKHLRVVLPEDLTSAVDLVQRDGVCVSTQSFVYSTSILISLLTASCLLSAYLWFTKQKQKSVQF